MKNQKKIKIALLVNQNVEVYMYVTRDEYNRCYNSSNHTFLPYEYCVKIPLTRYAYHPRVPANERWLHFAIKYVGKEFYDYLLNKYCPTF